MSTLRYSGSLRIRVTYVEYNGETFSDGTPRSPNGQYRCYIKDTNGGTPFKITVWVGTPAYLEHAVDSPESFDSAAHAALSFADDDNGRVSDRAAHTGSGWHIGRSITDVWGSPKVNS